MNATLTFPNTYGPQLRGNPRDKPRVKGIGSAYLGEKTTVKATASQAALALWKEEIKRGFRGQRAAEFRTWHLDPLWKGAALESSAIECEANGMWDTAARLRSEAALVLVTAGRGGHLA